MAGMQSNARGFAVGVLTWSIGCFHKIKKQQNSIEINNTTKLCSSLSSCKLTGGGRSTMDLTADRVGGRGAVAAVVASAPAAAAGSVAAAAASAGASAAVAAAAASAACAGAQWT